MILISNDFLHKRKIYNFEPYNVLLSITTNIAVLLMTADMFVEYQSVMLKQFVALCCLAHPYQRSTIQYCYDYYYSW